MSWSGLRWPLRCRAPSCVRDRKVLQAIRGKRPATRADGPSACPGNSLHERGRVSRNDANRDMQQAAKSIRVRNAGRSTCFRGGLPSRGVNRRWPGRLLSGSGCPVPQGAGRRVCRLRVGIPGAAGAVKRPGVPHAPSGDKGKQKTTGRPPAGVKGAMMHACSPDERPSGRRS